MKTKEGTLPIHGSYIVDIRDINTLMIFQNRIWGEEAPDADWAVILAMVRRAYPDVTMAELRTYPNKGYTFVAERAYATDLVAVYRHDWSWWIVCVPRDAYDEFTQGRQRARLAEIELPVLNCVGSAVC